MPPTTMEVPLPADEAIVYSVPEASSLLGMSPHTFRKAIRDGKVKAAMVGRVMKVSRAELAKYWRDIGGGELFTANQMDAQNFRELSSNSEHQL